MRTYFNKLIVLSLLLVGCSSKTNTYEKSCFYVDKFNYNNPVPYSDEVDETYFDNTLIAGDSRVGSLVLYNKLKNADVKFIESLSLSMFKITKIEKDKEDSKTLYTYIMDSDKENIYIMIGLNEIGLNSYEKWSNSYDNLIKEIKEKHPKSNIYMLSIYTVENAYKLKKELIKDKVDKMNFYIKKIASDNYVYYLDLDEALKGETGHIKDEYTFDGVHFTKEGTDAFIDYLKTHVGGSNYVQEVCE